VERCHITDYTVLSQHESSSLQPDDGKKRSSGRESSRTILSQYVLGISNWHFVRDHALDKTKELRCTPSDVQIYIKLSSDLFRSSSRSEVENEGEADFAFDRNSASFTYTCLISLLRSEEFQNLCKAARSKYEAKEGPLPVPVEEVDLEAELAAATGRSAVSITTDLDFRPLNLPPAEPEKKSRKAKRRLNFEDSASDEEQQQALEPGRSTLSRKKSGGHGQAGAQ